MHRSSRMLYVVHYNTLLYGNVNYVSLVQYIVMEMIDVPNGMVKDDNIQLSGEGVLILNGAEKSKASHYE